MLSRAKGQIWEEGFFDHVLRSNESYSQKWNYVRENPVRAGLVKSAADWPYQGEIVYIKPRLTSCITGLWPVAHKRLNDGPQGRGYKSSGIAIGRIMLWRCLRRQDRIQSPARAVALTRS